MTGPMGGGYGGRGGYEHKKVPPPRSPLDLPRYMRELLGGFLGRWAYIFMLVWETSPWILFSMMFMSVVNGVMPVVLALLSKNIINSFQDVLGGKITEFSVIFVMIITLFALRLVNNLLHRVSGIITRISGELVVNHIKVKIMDKAKTVDLASFDMPSFYEKLENANREAGHRPITILNNTFEIISIIISMTSFIVILSRVSVLSTVVVILVSIPSAVINFAYRRKTFRYMRHRSKDRRQMDYYSNTIVNKDLCKEIRLFDLSGEFIGRYKDVCGRYFGGLKKLILTEGAWHAGVTVLNTAVNCAFFIFIGQKVFAGDLKIGDYSLYTGALTTIASDVSSLINIAGNIYEGTLFIDNMIAFMEEEQTIVPRLPEPRRVAHGTGHTIEFVGVSFRYPGSERYVLKNINAAFRPGDTAVIVGLNGAGKTTLIKLLTRLYDPTEGYITLDGHDLRDYDVRQLYDMYGIIFQDFGKYAFTVAENIAFGNIHKTPVEDELREAAKKSSADEFIGNLTDGYNTPLMRIFEPNGTELSIGQWQKLAIARAFYGESDIIILDEPTASLDPMAEQEIFNQFDALRGDKTTIFVSHRLSSATIANKILVLENGEIIEEGDHRELMSLGGRYCELFSTQAKRYIEPPAAAAAEGMRIEGAGFRGKRERTPDIRM